MKLKKRGEDQSLKSYKNTKAKKALPKEEKCNYIKTVLQKKANLRNDYRISPR